MVNISTALSVTDSSPGTKGLNVEGKLIYVGEVKTFESEHGEFKSQFLVIAEDKELSIGASMIVKGDPIPATMKFEQVTLLNCKVVDGTGKDGLPQKQLRVNGGWTTEGHLARAKHEIKELKESAKPAEERELRKGEDRDRLILRQVSLKAAVESWKGQEFNADSVIKLADIYNAWLNSGE